MRLVIINHHPDCTYYIYEAFKHLGFDVYIASENLTRQVTPDKTSSTIDNMFYLAGKLIDPSMWGIFPKFTDKINEDDLIYTIHGKVCNNPLLKNNKIIMDIRCHHWLESDFGYPYNDNVIKIINHPNLAKKLNLFYVTNFVKKNTIRNDPKYFSTIYAAWDNSTSRNIASDMKDLAFISGAIDSPKGFIWDNDLLDQTKILGHEKYYGIHSYAVNKALSKGIPVYLNERTYSLEGFESLPRELFIFSETIIPLHAYNIATTMESSTIQKIYESNHNIQLCSQDIRKVIQIL